MANVGEQRRNSDAKVFLVNIELSDKDDLLRPAMTTSNKIITEEFKDVKFVPLEALHSQGDSISYVYKESGFNTVKQQVVVGKANTTHVIIKEGLAVNDKVYLSAVKGAEQNEIKMIGTQLSQK